MRHYSFDSLVGNASTTFLLKKSLQRGTFRQFSIFGGILGTGKSTCAGIVAMGLTCEDPREGLPCCQCKTCRLNMAALEETGDSPYVKVINLGLMSKFDDVGELIKNVFVLQAGQRNQVYILEEAHALKDVKGGFTAFLAEIDRMPLNVYVIMCTTKMNSIPRDLKSRAVIYNFGRLNKRESEALANSVLKRMGFSLSGAIVKMIVDASQGIPREIEKLITMTTEDELTEEEIRDYLQVVSDSEFINLFYAMKVSDLQTVVQMLRDALISTSGSVFCHALKDFLLKVMFLVEADISDDFTSSDVAKIKTVFTSETIAKTIGVAEKLGYTDEETDIMLAFVKIRAILNGRSEAAVITQKASVAAKEKIEMTRTERSKEANGDVRLTPLTMKSLEAFGGNAK